MPAMTTRSRRKGNDNTRPARSHLVEEMAGENRFIYWAFGLSIVFHLAFLGTFFVTQKHKPGRIPKTSVINVSLVASPQKAAGAKTPAKKAVAAPKPKSSKKQETRNCLKQALQFCQIMLSMKFLIK